MSVFVVLREYYYEGDACMGVFSSRIVAAAFIDRQPPEDRVDYRIVEWVVCTELA